MSCIITPLRSFVEKGYSVVSKPLFTENQTKKISRIFWAALACWSIYNLVDAGLARTLVLETLTHGTGPLGYIGINLFGADPNYGSASTGSSAAYGDLDDVQNSKGNFYVFKDSAYPTYQYPFIDNPFLNSLFYTLRLLPKKHAIQSGMATCGYSVTYNKGSFIQGIVGATLGYLTPVLKFRFLPKDVFNCEMEYLLSGRFHQAFECLIHDDPGYARHAYETAEPIPITHLGISGSLIQGINSDLWQRMSSDPYKVASGLALLGTAAIVAKMTYNYLVSPQKNEAATKTHGQGLKKTATTLFWTAVAVSVITLNVI